MKALAFVLSCAAFVGSAAAQFVVFEGRIATPGVQAAVAVVSRTGTVQTKVVRSGEDWSLKAPVRDGLVIAVTAPGFRPLRMPVDGDAWAGTLRLGAQCLEACDGFTFQAGVGASATLYDLPADGRIDERSLVAAASADGKGIIAFRSVPTEGFVVVTWPDAAPRGFLIDFDGRPLANATITGSPEPSVEIEEPSAAIDGEIEVEWPCIRPGTGAFISTRVVVHGPGMLTRDRTRWVWANPPRALANWHLADAGRDARFRSVPGTVIEAVSWVERGTRQLEAVESLTKKPIPFSAALDGSVPASGTIPVSAEDGGHDLLIVPEVPFEPLRVHVAIPKPDVRLDAFELTPRPVISGKVIGEKAPFEPAVVWYRRKGGRPDLRLGTTDESGAFGAVAFPLGAGEVWIEAASGRFSDVRAIAGGAAEKVFVDFALRNAASLSAAINGRAAVPAPIGVHLVALPVDPAVAHVLSLPPEWRDGATMRVLADPSTRHAVLSREESKFSISALRPGDYMLVVDAPGYFPLIEPVVSVTSALEIVLQVDRLQRAPASKLDLSDGETCFVEAWPWGGRRLVRAADDRSPVSMTLGAPGDRAVVRATGLAPQARGRRTQDRSDGSHASLKISIRRPPVSAQPLLVCLVPRDATTGGPVSSILVRRDEVADAPWSSPDTVVLRAAGRDHPWTTIGPFRADSRLPIVADVDLPRRARGRIWGTDGRLAGGAHVWIWPERDLVLRGARIPPIEGTTSSDGRLAWPDIPPGVARAWVGRAGEMVEIPLVGANAEDLGDIALQRRDEVPLDAGVRRWRDDAGRALDARWVPAFLAAHERLERESFVPSTTSHPRPNRATWIGAALDLSAAEGVMVRTRFDGSSAQLIPLLGQDVDPTRPMLQVSRDSTGAFVFPHVPDGPYTLTLSGVGLRQNVDVTMPPNRQRVLEFREIERLRDVHVRVVNEAAGRPITGARVELHVGEWADPAFFGTARRLTWLATATTDDTGVAVFARVPADRRFSARIRTADGVAATNTDIPAATTNRVSETIEVVVPIVGELDLRVNSGGLPVSGSTVAIYTSDGRLWDAPATTDTDGGVRFASVPAGKLTLVCSAPGYATRVEEFESPGGLNVSQLTVSLERGFGTTVIATDVDRRPLSLVIARQERRPLAPLALACDPLSSWASDAVPASDGVGVLALPPTVRGDEWLLDHSRFRGFALRAAPGATVPVIFSNPR